MKANEILHPEYSHESMYWHKYRSTYYGGKDFVNHWLRRLSTRENDKDFCNRRDITYCPAFAKSAINEIKNVIFNRLRDVTRQSNSNTYNQCIEGKLKGVDNAGATMDYFIGQYVIPELLTMRKVGVYIDMPIDVPGTLIGSDKIHPYLYLYKAETIKSWKYADPSRDTEFQSVLLYEDQLLYDLDTQLPSNKIERYRHVYLNDQGTVSVDFYNTQNNKININGATELVTYNLNIKEIPFVLFEISDSLLKDVADYQIALLNMESADIMYSITSNFPLYVEQFDETINNADSIPEFNEENVNATEAMITKAKESEAKVGPTYGRQYPKNTNAPEFIHPSAEPLTAAMEKEKQIKKDIKLLINLAVNDLSDKMVSAKSKQLDESGKQTGLACIAYVLENCENKIATYWSAYESKDDKDILVNYPKDYNIKSDEDRLKECQELWKSVEQIPSVTFKKTILKKIINVLLNDKVTVGVIRAIEGEIESAQGLLSSVDFLIKCVEVGTCDKATASVLLGFAEGVAAKAKKEHEAEAAAILASQTAISTAKSPPGGSARGVGATQTNQPSSSAEKSGKNQRGPAK